MQSEMDALDMLGQFLMIHLRDSAIECGTNLLLGKEKAVSLQRIQKAFMSFTPEQRLTVEEMLVQCVDRAIHDFLFALVVNADNHKFDEEGEEQSEHTPKQGHIQLLVDGKDAVDLAENLHWGPGEEWIAKYSKFSQ